MALGATGRRRAGTVGAVPAALRDGGRDPGLVGLAPDHLPVREDRDPRGRGLPAAVSAAPEEWRRR